jgi:predicted O-methyltransferase YrrM
LADKTKMSRFWYEGIAERARSALPQSLWRPLRALATACIAPVRFSLATGHWKSSLQQTARTAGGAPIPWYTYPAIDFLAQRDFADKDVLEFGGGQSTRWWAAKGRTVLTFEEDGAWYESLRAAMAPNVALHHAPIDFGTRAIDHVRAIIADNAAKRFDVVIIDGHLRRELVNLAFEVLAPGGAILLDNAEGYGFADEIRSRDCRKIDFFGFAPGVSKRHCTSLVFVGDCFLLDPKIPIPVLDGAGS